MKIRKTKNDILMSIAPEWIVKILNGIKTIEVRKMFPKDYVGWVYIYCTRTGKKLFDNKNGQLGKCVLVDDRFVLAKGNFVVLSKGKVFEPLNGTVVARFWCDNVEEIKYKKRELLKSPDYYIGHPIMCNPLLNYLYNDSCLSFEKMHKYLNGKNGYAIHISKLEIFDKPKLVSEFLKPDTPTYEETKAVLKDSQPNYSKKDFLYSQKLFHNIIERAPQSWCYAREA